MPIFCIYRIKLIYYYLELIKRNENKIKFSFILFIIFILDIANLIDLNHIWQHIQLIITLRQPDNNYNNNFFLFLWPSLLLSLSIFVLLTVRLDERIFLLHNTKFWINNSGNINNDYFNQLVLSNWILFFFADHNYPNNNCNWKFNANKIVMLNQDNFNSTINI